MVRAVITNLGKARLEDAAASPVRQALTVLAEAPLEASDPEALFVAFGERIGGDAAACRSLWEELGRTGAIKVRRPLQTAAEVAFVTTDPPVETFRAGWGGKRPGAGLKPRDPAGRKRVQRTVTLAPDVHTAILDAQAESESYSDTLDRLVRGAVGR